MRPRTLSALTLPLLVLLPMTLGACSEAIPGGNDAGSGTGGTSSGVGGSGTGGSNVPATSGGAGTGGGSSAGGASINSGGSVLATGGNLGAGGAGGESAGGAPGTGGSGDPGSGGSTTGGGGNAVTGDWGTVEDPGASCEVGPMPSVDSLVANAKLPDPFTKMDGTRITDKSEWVCRREEILQQAYEFIYGEKPVPAKESVTGSVSNSGISVQVSDAGGSTTFMATVNMNGATAPAPAIIYYGNSGAPAPNGVAKITFDPIESQGGSGPKNGPFYDVYGANHPAGYLAAQAWQVSRIIDVLEQDPGIIDPTRLGVTGCSRWGKGAFVAGVLDNRVALTIPVESGLGGTVGLRLVEVMDTYSGSEWPYHGISYVRWLSEVALGPFTSGNSASADNTDKLPVDMHEMMGLIAPRGLYIVDNPSTMYNGLDRNSAWVTANVGKQIFEALGVGDHMSYQGAGGSHCMWRSAYDASLNAMIDKFLKGNDSAATGNFATDLPNPPGYQSNIDWDVPTLSGEL